MNVQVVTDPAGEVLWISPALPGRTHDLAAAQFHKIIRICEWQGVPVLADCAYQGAGAWVTTGLRHPPKGDLAPTQRTVNRALALTSGLMAHRSALHSKSVELEYAERQRRDEQLATQRREELSGRRASYSALNQRLRQFHSLLSRHYLALESGHASAQQGQDREEPQRVLRDVYAEAQMVISDDVLVVGGNLIQQLHRIHFLLGQHEQEIAIDEALDDIRERLERASEFLYEVRQTMRRDLGISELPIHRPDGYGTT